MEGINKYLKRAVIDIGYWLNSQVVAESKRVEAEVGKIKSETIQELTNEKSNPNSNTSNKNDTNS